MSKELAPKNVIGIRQFFKRLLPYILIEREKEFPDIAQRFFSESPITPREKQAFDNGYMMAYCHVMRGLSDHLAAYKDLDGRIMFEFKSLPPETTEPVPVIVTEAPTSKEKVN